MQHITNYGHLTIDNFSLIKNKRLQKEICVLHRLTEGSDDFLNCYDKLKKKVTNSNIIENIISIKIIEENHILVDIIFQEKYILLVSLIFPKEYPFKPPKVKISGINYSDFLGEYQNSGLNNRKKCLCCNTIICRHNWAPDKDLFDVIIEIYNILDLLYSPINENLYKTILNKHLGYLID
jgi:ubiquitin-protein ligase